MNHINNPKISIMMLAYDCDDFLGEAIQSVLEQTIANWELIIIDDGSSDETPRIAKKFADRYERIKYFRNQENLGIPKSRNRALKEAAGEYIAVLDGDDKWTDKDKLEKQVEFLDEYPAYGAVGSSGVYIDAESSPAGEKLVEREDASIRRWMPFTSQIINSSSMFRAKLAQEVGGYDNSFEQSQDYELWLALGETSKLKNLKDKMVGYRIHGKNTSTRARRKQLTQTLQALKMHPDFAPRLLMYSAYWLKKIYIQLLKISDKF